MTDMGPISVVSAGAGTGKTWRLSTEYVNAAHSGASPARIIATTFTIKAAAELVERVRARLIQEGYAEAAQSALAGLVGTVNSVCGRLVSDFAIDGGLSPVADVIPPEMANSLFGLATEEAIQKFSPKIDLIADRLRQDDWRKTVLDIVNLARGSGLEPKQFSDFALKSWQGIEPLLAPVTPNETPADLDRTLADAIRSCVWQIDAGGDDTKTTKNTLTVLRQVASQMSNGRPLAWDAWARVSKLKAAKASEPFLQTVRAIAARHPTHPRLHTDLHEFIDLVFACAAEALDHFSEFKRARGLLDFTDQEALALELLRQPEVRARMRERFDLLMVDEFQDTSPIQLAVFLEMAKAVKRSLWVGDQKQAIFGFRQTDPGARERCDREDQAGDGRRRGIPRYVAALASQPGSICERRVRRGISAKGRSRRQGRHPETFIGLSRPASDRACIIGSWREETGRLHCRRWAGVSSHCWLRLMQPR
jgi:ATP-dependent helicase/nuclease subunit A